MKVIIITKFYMKFIKLLIRILIMPLCVVFSGTPKILKPEKPVDNEVISLK